MRPLGPLGGLVDYHLVLRLEAGDECASCAIEEMADEVVIRGLVPERPEGRIVADKSLFPNEGGDDVAFSGVFRQCPRIEQIAHPEGSGFGVEHAFDVVDEPDKLEQGKCYGSRKEWVEREHDARPHPWKGNGLSPLLGDSVEGAARSQVEEARPEEESLSHEEEQGLDQTRRVLAGKANDEMDLYEKGGVPEIGKQAGE